MFKLRKFRVPATAIVALSVLMLILLGTALLCLPAASKGEGVSFVDALFTATSASCVTGLTVKPTFGTWTLFGQIVILILIQIGGLGFITISSLFLLYVKKHSSLSQRKLVMQSAGSVNLSGIRGLVKIILLGTLIFELAGAFLLSFAFVPVYGWGIGIWSAIFTSVSAFCNAGFTLTDATTLAGVNQADSVMRFANNPLVLIVIALLIIIGGIGFFVWGDVLKNGVHIKRYSFHAKVALSTTLFLIVAGWLLFALLEWNNPKTIGNYSIGTKILDSFFLSVSPRTAGFDVVAYQNMTSGGNALTIVLMLIGGSPGSTAGGVKTTTVTVFILTMIATARNKDEIHIFKRRFEKEASSQASAIVCVYLFVYVISVIALCGIEGGWLPLDFAMFEIASAMGTVGSSCNVTGYLCTGSKVLLSVLMFFGRVGGFTLVLVFSGDKKPVTISHVSERIIVG